MIDPLFNKFEPLDKSNPELVDAIEKVTQRGGMDIPRDRMFLMKASEKVTTLNAYVTGFGPSKRVVVWDTTIKNATTPETLFVFGHEMGHYVLNHIVIGIVSHGGRPVHRLLSALPDCQLDVPALPAALAHARALGLGSTGDAPSDLLHHVNGFRSPLATAISRQLEHNADIYGLEVTHGINPNSQEAAAHAFQVLGELVAVLSLSQ